jgi:acyl-coenzyme A synthetase/AMP-(fatty) acid ligase
MNKISLPPVSVTYTSAIRDIELSNQDWWQQVHSKYLQIEALPYQHWLLFAEDSFDFSCCFFALLLAGKTPVLPPNLQAETLKQFAQELDAVCADRSVDKRKPDVCSNYEHSAEAASYKGVYKDIDAEQEIFLYTSGSTGEPKRVVKKWRQLQAEVETLESCFGENVEQTTICGSVSHQHIYGLLFTVLWPLLSQRAWQVRPIKYIEDYCFAVKESISFVSSPSFLEHLSLQMTQLDSRPSYCFSSGGALKNETVKQLAQQWQQAPTEVFGSSETGGVAYRNQLVQQHWSVFKCIEWRISANKALQIKSPYLDDVERWHEMDDAVEECGNGFKLLGRLDRIVKIAEKRVCLDQMSRLLEKHQWVTECDLLTLSSSRDCIAAVVVLNNRGLKQLKASKHAVNQTLRMYLADYFETVTLPRKWRYIDNLMVNSQGKRQIAKMRSLFT